MSRPLHPTSKRTGDSIANCLDEIRSHFADKVHVTLYVRSPVDPERDMLISDEPDLADVVKAMERRIKAPESRRGFVQSPAMPKGGTA